MSIFSNLIGPDGKLRKPVNPAQPAQPILPTTGLPAWATPPEAPPPQPIKAPVTMPVVGPDPNPQVTPPLDNMPKFSPFDLGSIKRSGAYGESVAFRATDYLTNLRKALDAGQLSVADFLKLGQPAAETAFKEIQSVGGKGSKAADLVNPLLDSLQGAGFIKGDDGVIRPKLPDQYNKQQINDLLPKNVSDADKQDLISQLPPGVDPNSDAGKIELENLREKSQQKVALNQQQDLRNKAITGLEGIIGQQRDIRNSGIPALRKSLEDEANRQFSLDQPGLLEDLNARGLLRSSALGESLARQKGIYAGDIASRLGQAEYSNTQQSADDLNKLAAARLTATDSDVQAIQQGLINSNQLQQSGLSRQFGLQDFQTQANMARAIAAMSQPQQTGGNAMAGGFAGALGGATLGAKYGPGGAVAGGLLGGVGGYASSKGGGK